MKDRSARRRRRFDVHHGKPQGPEGGNNIDLTNTDEAERVLATMRTLGYTTVGMPQPADLGAESTATHYPSAQPDQEPAPRTLDQT